MGKRKRVVVDMGLHGEKITDVVEGPRNAPIRIGSWEQYVKHFGGFAATADDSQAVRAYFNEGEIIDEENMVDSPMRRDAIVRIGSRFGMTHSAAVAACHLAYLLHKRSNAMRKRERTVGDVVTAAAEQGKETIYVEVRAVEEGNAHGG